MTDLIEIWKDIPNYEGLYKISNLGNIYSYRKMRNMIISPSDITGYVAVGLYKDKVQTLYYVHRLVAQAFIPNPEDLPVVHHKDDVKHNNCVNNLEWCTQKENVHHTIIAKNHGTMGRRKTCKNNFQFL